MKSEKHKEFSDKLISLVGEDKACAIRVAIENNVPVIIKGPQGATGKTTLRNLINENGGIAVEEKLCLHVTLNNCLLNSGSNEDTNMTLRRFEIIDEQNIKAFQNLIVKKNLNKNDLELILSTVKLC